MYKVIISLFIAFFLLLSCDKNRTPIEKNHDSKYTNKSRYDLQDTVILSISTTVFKITTIPDTVRVAMINSTADTLTTGLHYEIQRLESNKWVKVLPDQMFQDIGFAILPNHSKSFTVKMMKDQAAYKSGDYRIAKYYLNQDFRKTKKHYFVYAEFRIE